MSRSSANDDRYENAIERRQLAPDPDVQQAKYFQALLDERHSQVLREICDRTAALTQSQASDGTSAMHHVRRGLAATYREQVDLDRLRNSLRVRLAADVPQIAKAIRPFDIVLTRRRAGWRMEIPEFDIVLTNIDSRTDAEVVSRSIIAAITGLRIAQVEVRSRLALQSYRRPQQ
jgi:hypothetical protein